MKATTLAKIVSWEFINNGILKSKRNRKYQFPSNYLVLNVGCGIDNPALSLGIDGGVYVLYKSLPRFILKRIFKSTDISQNYTLEQFEKKIKSTRIIHHDLKYGLPFSDSSVPCIFTSHFLEHLDYASGSKFLRECYRVLKPGGSIRICVPSLDEEVDEIKQAVTSYESGSISSIQKYLTEPGNEYKGPYALHRHMYNFKELSKVLATEGFENIEESSFKSTKIPNFYDIDTKHGLIVEAKKAVS